MIDQISTKNILPSRKSIRLPGYDYAQAGMCFVTICTLERKPLFGRIENGVVVLSDIGRIVEDCWQSIPDHFSDVMVDEFVVMPDHMHGLISVGARLTGHPPFPCGPRSDAVPVEGESSAFGKPHAGALSTIVGSFKSAVTKQCNAVAGTACRAPTNVRTSDFTGQKIWQRGFWERVIRNERELAMVREYIRTNPLRTDDEHDLSVMFDAQTAAAA